MKVSVNWLKELVAVDLPADELAHKLTMSGLEVEEMTPVAPAFDQIVIAHIKTIAPHPDADKLRVCEVDAGTGETLQIVCGAPNAAAGLKVPCALVGAKLPLADGKILEIKQAKLRGVASSGMLCSARELGLSEDHAGLMVLPENAPVGTSIRTYLDLDDVYLTLKMTPNRGDCLSMVGIARDLAAVLSAELKVPAIEPVAAKIQDQRSVKLSEPKACSTFCARIIRNIDAKAESPEWMRRRLERAGFRAISPLVDITNYLTLERGRPLHAFDLDKLKGGIDVRFPKAGEELDLLNDQHVVLTPDTLVVCDESGPVGLGGVMGGRDTMVTDTTTSVLFEAAYFDPDVVQGKTRELGLTSDAAFRFERGVDFKSAREGIEYATRLTLEICGGEAGPITEAVGELPVRKPVKVRLDRATRLIGMAVPVVEIENIFTRLQCKVEKQGDSLRVTAPSFRFDLNIEEDFIEEIARVHGYEHVPAEPPRSALPMLPAAEGLKGRTTLKRALAQRGFQEVINYSFISSEWELDFAGNERPVRVANPIASHMEVMRTQLLGGLIDTLKGNLNRGEARLRLFEIGRCFLADEADVKAQPEKLGVLAYGPRYPEQWGEDKEARSDFFALKGDLEALHPGLRFEAASHPAMHPGRSAVVKLGEAAIGFIGELHPRWQQKHGLPLATVYFELVTGPLLEARAPRYQPISRMQAVRRDIAILVDEGVSAQALLDAVKPVLGVTVTDFAVFDLYRGPKLETGKKSVAFRVLMQDTDRTLTDEEADATVGTIVDILGSNFGATLRK